MLESKRIDLEYQDNTPFLRSYTGKDVLSKKCKIGLYNKNCGSASIIEIEIEEVSMKGRLTHLSYTLNKEQAIELRNKLNEVEF
jgi:hypothetical protein